MKSSTAHWFFLAFLFTLLFAPLFAQSFQDSNSGSTSMPDVFLLGEYASQYEGMMPGYAPLLDVCGGDMQVAHQKLMSMMKEMEAFARVLDYDLRGVKAWMHFFFDKDGSIRHIGFYLKPGSRNVDRAELETFLRRFSGQYRFPLTSQMPFSHYSSFSFPVL